MRAKRLRESVPWVIHLLESERQCVSLCASVRVRQSVTALCIFLHVISETNKQWIVGADADTDKRDSKIINIG